MLLRKRELEKQDKIGFWSAYIGQATTPYALTGAIPLLLAASTLNCWMSPLARIALP